MPLFTYRATPGAKQLVKLNRCARSKRSALDALIAEHGPVVRTIEIPRKGTTLSGEPPKPATRYVFEDGTQAQLVAYVGMC